MKTVYEITTQAATPLEAGKLVAEYRKAGSLIGGYFNPFEPDSIDGEEFNEGVYSVTAKSQ